MAKGNRKGPAGRKGSGKRNGAGTEKGADYEVGYRKPPLHTQFRKGKSGNPNGRPKETRRLDRTIQAELDRVVNIVIEGRQTAISKKEASARQLFAKALRGDARAFEMLMRYATEGEPDEPKLIIKHYPDDQEPP